MKFTKIGTAEATTTKQGKKALRLHLDPQTKKMFDHDYADGIWIFYGDYGLTVSGVMPDDYVYKKWEKPKE